MVVVRGGLDQKSLWFDATPIGLHIVDAWFILGGFQVQPLFIGGIFGGTHSLWGYWSSSTTTIGKGSQVVTPIDANKIWPP